ncbi:Alpha-glucosidase [Hexamita inflata]|uniref:Alpha-glucosidase n=1 Tax=Hexamita inflata TaxID=28002 RepID=A0AA86RJM9_9EUKA|nr:Alpha-glucosidase [Hexamita inflata]
MPEWWRERVIYQIYPRSFKDSNGDGVGDLVGITQKLDYLKDLGIGAIWISPFFKSPQADCGYDVSDYRAVDPMFGSDQDFETLLARAHELDIKVIIDLVLNHTSCEHPWFQEARKSKDNPKHDWYIWHDGPKPPNNWLCGFTLKNAWCWNEQTKEYYLGQFTPEQPEVNWRNKELHDEMMNVLKFWLQRGVDGFRLDVVNFYFKDAQMRSNPRKITRMPYMFMDHKYDRNQPEVLDVAAEMRQICNSFGERALIGEVYADDTDLAAQFQGNNDRLNIAYNFDFLYQEFSGEMFRKSAQKHYQSISKYSSDNQPNFTLSNHDQVRACTRYHDSNPARDIMKQKIMCVMLLTLRGTPTIYYGEEIGMKNVKVPKHLRMDPVAHASFPVNLFGRDPERTPMQWSGAEHCGFSQTQPWLPVGDVKINVEDQINNPDSLLSFYKLVLKLRNESRTLKEGDINIMEGTGELFGYRRTFEGEKIQVYLNFGNKPVQVSAKGKILVQQEIDVGEEHITLKALAILVIQRE